MFPLGMFVGRPTIGGDGDESSEWCWTWESQNVPEESTNDKWESTTLRTKESQNSSEIGSFPGRQPDFTVFHAESKSLIEGSQANARLADEACWTD